MAGNRFGPVTIRDIFIDGGSQGFGGGTDHAMIQASETDSIIVRNCIVQASGWHGIYLSKCSGALQNNDIPGSSEFGILSLDSDKAVLIDQNRVTFSGNNGIYIYRSAPGGDQSVISNNQIGFTSANSGGTGPYGNAVILANASYAKVVNNMIYTSAFSAIRCASCSNLEINGNQCYNSTENAIYVEAPGEGATWYGGIVANNRVDLCGGGIVAANSNFGAHWIVITGNQVSDCVQNPIPDYGTTWGNGIYVEADGLVTNNQVDSAAGWGIAAYSTNNGSIGAQKVLTQIENNMVKNCAGGIAFYKDDTTYGRILIGGNMVYNYTTTTRFAAIVPASLNGATGEVSKLPGATDLGNATTSGFANVKLIRNYSFT